MSRHSFAILVNLFVFYYIGLAILYMRPRHKEPGSENWMPILITGLIALCIALPTVLSQTVQASAAYLALLIMAITTALLGMAIFYMRPKAILRTKPNPYTSWKFLFWSSLLAFGIGALLLIAPGILR